jgi:hypothetical protein
MVQRSNGARARPWACAALGLGLALMAGVSGCGDGGSNPSPTSSSAGSGGNGGNGGSGGAGGDGGSSSSSGTGGQGGAMASHGPPATDLVSAGTVGKSPGYRMVFTLGQPSQAQGTMNSPSHRLQGGLVGANGSSK